MTHRCFQLIVLFGIFMAVPAVASAQTTRRVPPRAGYTFLDEQKVDRFSVQRWASPDSPRDSPSGYCECITLVFEGDRQVVVLESAGIQQISSLADVTGDQRAELVVLGNSGGAHCCHSTSIYSVEGAKPRPLLAVMTDNCPGDLTDVDGDGRTEFTTCDDTLAYEFCSFAFSPMPPAIFAYEPMRARFVLATRRFASRLPAPTDADVKAAFEEARGEADLVRCAALGPAVHTIYTGSIAEGQRRFRQLYREPDAASVEEQMLRLVRASELWTPE